MDNISILTHTDEALQQDPNARSLGFTYALWAAGISLALQLVSYIAGTMTTSTGGLGGIGMRSALQTVQTLSMYVSMIALPFLQYGHMAVGLRTARGETSQKSDLLHGFRRFFPFVRLALAWTALMMMLCVAVSNLSATIYLFLPGSTGVLESLQTTLSDPNALVDPELALSLLQQMWPMYAIFGVLLIALSIPLFYRLRLVEWHLLGGENRVVHTMLASWKQMRGHCKQLFFLDLRFWSYHALTVLASIVAYGDQLLGLSGDVAYWCAIALSLLIQFAATALYLPRLHTAQAQFYLTHYTDECKMQNA